MHFLFVNYLVGNTYEKGQVRFLLADTVRVASVRSVAIDDESGPSIRFRSFLEKKHHSLFSWRVRILYKIPM